MDHEVETRGGIYYYGYRHYSPELGRWLSRDPIAENGGVNLYAMVGNDAVNRWDLLGLKEGKDKCISVVRAGHTPQINDMDDYPASNSPCDRFTGVGCFSGDNNENLKGSVDYEGEKFDDPQIPNYIPNPKPDPQRPVIPNPAEPGYLWPNEAYDALASAVEAARHQAAVDCGTEGNCCKTITVKVECPQTPDGDGLDFYGHPAPAWKTDSMW
jgi:RHS repeat-associated protein